MNQDEADKVELDYFTGICQRVGFRAALLAIQKGMEQGDTIEVLLAKFAGMTDEHLEAFLIHKRY